MFTGKSKSPCINSALDYCFDNFLSCGELLLNLVSSNSYFILRGMVWTSSSGRDRMFMSFPIHVVSGGVPGTGESNPSDSISYIHVWCLGSLCFCLSLHLHDASFPLLSPLSPEPGPSTYCRVPQTLEDCPVGVTGPHFGGSYPPPTCPSPPCIIPGGLFYYKLETILQIIITV